MGTSGIGLNNVMFFSDREDNNAHFALSNSVVNGITFATLAQTGGEINFQNVQGCTQLIADKINLSDIRLARCAFGGGGLQPGPVNVPEPISIGLFAAGLAGVGWQRRRARQLRS